MFQLNPIVLHGINNICVVSPKFLQIRSFEPIIAKNEFSGLNPASASDHSPCEIASYLIHKFRGFARWLTFCVFGCFWKENIARCWTISHVFGFVKEKSTREDSYKAT